MKIFIYVLFFVFLYANNLFAWVYVRNLNDVNGSYTPGVDMGNKVFFEDFCALSWSDSGNFELTFSSANAKGARFRTKNNSNNRYLGYDLFFYENSGGVGSRHVVNSGIPLKLAKNNDGMNEFEYITSCLIGDNSSIEIVFRENRINKKPAGVYSDVLTIEIKGV